jgi:hypothetical protein
MVTRLDAFPPHPLSETKQMFILSVYVLCCARGSAYNNKERKKAKDIQTGKEELSYLHFQMIQSHIKKTIRNPVKY